MEDKDMTREKRFFNRPATFVSGWTSEKRERREKVRSSQKKDSMELLAFVIEKRRNLKII